MCSFHFKDGQPTAENPYPSQLLGAGFGPQYFCGKPPKIEVTQESMSQVFKIIILLNEQANKKQTKMFTLQFLNLRKNILT